MDLRTKLDTVFSIFIRLRDADTNGNVRCISCPRLENWKNIDCGHFIKRGNTATRYHEKNANGQCKYCNQGKDGNESNYEIGLLHKYGPEVLEELRQLKHSTLKLSRSDYLEKIEYYSKAVQKLKKQKGL